MAVYIRLDDAVRARLRGGGRDAAAGCTSSGSDHDASACLSGLVKAFLETGGGAAEDGGPAPPREHGGSDSDEDGPARAAAAAASVRALLDPPAEEDVFRIRLAAAVAAAAEAEAALRAHGGPAFRRAVARRLRGAGFDAGVCRSRWEASGGITAGSYEYVDVVAPAPDARGRYIVDADFRAGLEVARATPEYAAVVAAVPASAVVAREEAVGRAVRVASDAARRSLRAHGLHVPPWRKTRYMLAKWLGPYKRSTATAPAAAPAAAGAMPMPGGAGLDVKCRAVGFFAPPATAPAARIK